MLRASFVLTAVCCTLVTAPVPAAVVISEFLAENDGGLRDAEGQSEDWIELHNNGAAPVNLAGWHLTDDPARLKKWTFPPTNLAAGGFLIAFASGKDRAVAGAELHTNFRLEGNGGYLALVGPDGVTVAHAYAPAYPRQRANVSFGFAASNTLATLIATNANARWFVPPDGALGSSWTLAAFNDAGWSAAKAPLRYDIAWAGGAPVLSIDVNARAANSSDMTHSGFSSFIMGGGSGIQSGPITRTYGVISVTLSNSNAAVGYDDRVRATPVNSGAFTQEDLLRDFVFSSESAGTSGLDVFIAGLTANAEYNITLWSFDTGSSGNRVSDWSANGVLVKSNYGFNGSFLPVEDSTYRFTFRAPANAGGAVLISGRRDAAAVDQGGAPSFGVFFNALQVAPVNASPTTNGNLALMAGDNASVYARLHFFVGDPAAYDSLTLRVRYDDGFIAYVNGVEVARRNAPAGAGFDAAATGTHSAVTFEDIVLPGAASLLTAGNNVLAIQGLNISAGDADFLLEPELLATLTPAFDTRYFKPPTPGFVNGPGFLGIVEDPRFSVERGFYGAPFLLSITTATPGATIHYTTDGGVPGPGSGSILQGSLAITNTAFIRAVAHAAGQNLIPSESVTHSYIFLESVLRQPPSLPGYPSTWQASYPADYGMDPAIVNHPVYGTTISNDLRRIPTLSIVSQHAGLWSSSSGIYPNATSSGTAWERAASVELIDGDGTTEFAVSCKIEMHGNASRDNVRTPKHSMRLTFSADYGPARLRHDWFGGGVDTHDRIVLRSCGFVDGWAGRYADSGTYTSSETGETFRGLRYRPENTCYLRDLWVKDSFRDMGWTASRSAFVHLYLNGLYWGIYQPSEHLDASYFSAVYGGREGAWDVIVGDDGGGPPVAVDGSVTDWQTVLNLVNAGITTESAYAAVTNVVDIDNLIDYMMLHIFAEAEDWPHHNWYVARRRAADGLPATRFICTVWDQELTLDRLVRRNRINVGGSGGEVYSPGRVYQQLRAWPEFRRQFGDRVHKHLFNDGALTPAKNIARLLARAGIIHEALVGESARWGDARETGVPAGQIGTGVTFTRDEWWQPEMDKLTTNFFQKLTAENTARFRAGNLYPGLAAPHFSQFGGNVTNGFKLIITHTNASGTIFFTTDGTDPRVYGSGTVAPGAKTFTQPVPVNAPTPVRARVQSGGQWSALVEAVFYPPQDLSRLALTEVMYHPPDFGATDGDEFEFIELRNTGTNELDLSGLRLDGEVIFTFTNSTLLAPGEYFVLVANASAFASKYPGVQINGVYSGRLANGGGAFMLSHALGTTIFTLNYGDDAPWPVTPDGFGFSLVPKQPGVAQAPDEGTRWRASATVGGSPGAEDAEPAIPPVVINELLTHAGPAQVNAVELFNPTAAEVDIGGWSLTDDPGVPVKYRITNGTIIAANGYLLFDETTHFNATPGTNQHIALSPTGGRMYLFSGDLSTNLTGYSHGFEFGAAELGISFGRHINSVGEEQFPAQVGLSLLLPNSGPRIDPVVINEIHYHPLPGGDEFIEIKNISSSPVRLFHPAFPANSWRVSGLGFQFPTNVIVPPQTLALLVATNPPDFIAKYSVPASVPVFGPYSRPLQDDGERIGLARPDQQATSDIPYISGDSVRFNDLAPWPPAAAGSGPSLQRLLPHLYGDDPVNWTAALPTPGRELDTDGDGIPDFWELEHGTRPAVADGGEDPDSDGFTNLQEFVAGTDAFDRNSALRFEEIRLSGADLLLRFNVPSNRVVRVLYADDVHAPTWSVLQEVPMGSQTRPTVVGDQPTNSSRFYRLVVP